MSARVVSDRTDPWDTRQPYKAECLDCEVEWAWGYDWRKSEAAADAHNAEHHAVENNEREGAGTMSEKRSLREAHEAIESIVGAVKTLLGVAALDVEDAYGDDTLVDVFMVKNRESGGSSHRDLPIARRFAEMLVYRLLHTPEIILDWVAAEPADIPGFAETLEMLDNLTARKGE